MTVKDILKSYVLAFVVCALLAIPHQVMAGDVRTLTDRSSGSVSTSVAATLMAANNQRHYLFIQNIGTDNIWINFTGTAAVSTAGSFKLSAGASVTFEADTVVKNAVSIKAETTTGKVTAYEG